MTLKGPMWFNENAAMIANITSGKSYTGSDFDVHLVVKNTDMKTPIALMIASKFGFIVIYIYLHFFIVKKRVLIEFPVVKQNWIITRTVRIIDFRVPRF